MHQNEYLWSKGLSKPSKGSLNNTFQDSVNKILSQQLTYDRSYIYLIKKKKMALIGQFCSKPITRLQILDSSKVKVFADANFKFDENGRKLPKRVENTVGKGEIACYKQFLLFPQCFQKACFPGASKGIIVWEWVKRLNKMCL